MALPGVIRSGSIGTESLSMGTMPSAQQQITMGQMHRGHMPPLVRAGQQKEGPHYDAVLYVLLLKVTCFYVAAEDRCVIMLHYVMVFSLPCGCIL